MHTPLKQVWVLLALSGAATMAQVPGSTPALGGATRPTTAPTAATDENPFLTNDVPLSQKPAITPEAVVRFALIDGFLMGQTTLRPSTPQMQRVAGLANPVHIGITHRSGSTAEGGGYYSPDMLVVNYVSNEDGRWLRTSLSIVINHFSLSRDTIASGTEHTVQFIQSAQPQMAGKAASLYVQSLGSEDTGEKLSYSAEHFGAFIRVHPAETTRYLRPMVEVLAPQPHLFVVDDSLGCSVFPEAFAANDARREAMLELVKQLNADDFQKRQQATKALEEIGVVAAVMLATLDRGSMPPEQAARVDAIISRIKPVFEVNVELLRSDPGFLLDCLLSENATLREAALGRLNKVIGQAVSFEAGPDDASRIKAVYDLRAKLLVTASPATQPAAPR